MTPDEARTRILEAMQRNAEAESERNKRRDGQRKVGDMLLTYQELQEIRERSRRWATQERMTGSHGVVTQRDLEPVNASQAAHDRADLLDHLDSLRNRLNG